VSMANQQLLNVRKERPSWPACFNVKESESETGGFSGLGADQSLAWLDWSKLWAWEESLQVREKWSPPVQLQMHPSGVDEQLRRRV